MPLITRTPEGFYRSHNAVIVGDVVIGELCSIWFNAVIRGDVAPVRIGRRVNVQDGAIIHCDSGVTNTIEDDVIIAHGAIVHGARVGSGALIGMGARVMGRTVVGSEAIVAAGAVVPPGMEIPDRMVAMGIPAKIVRPANEEELKYIRWIPGHYVKLAEEHVAGKWG